MRANRRELAKVELQVLAGKLPEDLSGHLFFIAPSGSVSSGGLPFANGDPIFNGDGMIYRVDFNQKGTAFISSRLAETPDYYADLATQKQASYRSLMFRNHGVSRFSLGLGMRNQLNTALVPCRFAQDTHDRLLVTFDAGRHYELNPETLAVVTPVGSNQEWRPETTLLSPFLPILSTAHPCFDGNTQELFTVNYGRSLGSFLNAIPLLRPLVQGLGKLLQPLAAVPLPGGMSDFVYLMRWDGHGEIERWRLVLPDGSPVAIDQSLHQVAMTQHYIILADTAFSLGLAQVFNNPLPGCKRLERVLRFCLSSPPAPETRLYFVKRADLKDGQKPAQSGTEMTVTVQCTTVPLEVLHFAADYDDTGDRITLHLGHICADDAADWIRSFDVAGSCRSPNPPAHLYGMQSEVMDVSRLGRYEIDAASGQILKATVVSDVEKTWGVEFYTYRTYPTIHRPTERLQQIYWTSYGFWPELLTRFSVLFFKGYKYRTIAMRQLQQWAAKGQGKPACLFRLDTQTMTIADCYAFDGQGDSDRSAYLVNSPQFVPRLDATDLPTDGYLICTVFTPQRCEIWIFDAQALSQGPVCKLAHPDLAFGFTLHSAWLPTIAPRTASYNIPVRADYAPLIQTRSAKIRQLFEKEIYPHFEA